MANDHEGTRRGEGPPENHGLGCPVVPWPPSGLILRVVTAMTEDIDIDGLDNADDLKAVLRTMQSRISHLEGRVDALHSAREYLIDEVEELRDENDDLREQIRDVGGHVELVEGTMNTPEQGKLEKIVAILDYAATQATGGPSGKTIKTGEAAAAAGAGRNTALRLMDEIGANFSWAETETPGGPNPKRLKITLSGADLGDLKADVRDHYAGEATTA